MRLNEKTFVLLAALPLVFVSRNLENAIYAGLGLIVVSLAIKGLSYVLPKFASDRFLVYVYIIASAALITIATLVYQTFFSVQDQVGLYLSLLIVNGALLFPKGEEQSFLKHSVYTLIAFGAILATGLLREFLATGGIELLFGSSTLFDSEYGLTFLQDASGGFIVAGLLFALVQKFIPNDKEVEKDAV